MNKMIKKLNKLTKNPVVAVIVGIFVTGGIMYFSKDGLFGNKVKDVVDNVSDGLTS